MVRGIGVYLRGLLVALVTTCIAAAPSSAINVLRCVSQDNHVYVVLTTASDRTQVTSVALTNGAANGCCENPTGGPAVLTAVAAGSGMLLPNRERTTVIDGLPSNSISCGANFNASAAGGQGQLTLPGGATVSANNLFSTETVVSVTTGDSVVPAAFDVPAVSRTITGCSISGETMAFPSTAGVYTPSDVTLGEVASQTVTHDDTEGSTIGNRAPGNNVPPTQSTPDGFRLEGDCSSPGTCEVIVFIATQDGNVSAGAAAAAFETSLTDLTLSTECNAASILFNSPTPTPTSTPTNTPTQTSTFTPTVTPTNTNTPTNTGTATPSNTPVPTSTGTHTQTPTPTSEGICPVTPVSGCRTPVGFSRPLRISDKKDLTTWRWRTQGNLLISDLGDPVNTTTYSLCIYAGAVPTRIMELRAPVDGICPVNKPCWKSKGPKGFRYSDRDATPNGIKRLRLRTTPPALADIVVRARGPNVPIPSLPLTGPVIAQLIKSDGPECWQSNYSLPAKKNNTQIYLDKND